MPARHHREVAEKADAVARDDWKKTLEPIGDQP
jgi:hypothetical protein